MATNVPIHFGWILLFLGVILTSCQPVVIQQPEQRTKASLLINLNAPVEIKREGWTNFQQVGFGTLVYPTDLLRTKGQISLLCTDMQSIKTLTSLGRNPCPMSKSEQAMLYGNMLTLSGQRSVLNSGVPYILYPRSTTILESHPLLRWHSTNAASYTVEIRQGASLVWQQNNVTRTNLVYPAAAPELIAGKDYLLVVTDNTTGLDSTLDSNVGLGFQVISSEQRTKTNQQAQDLRSLVEMDPTAQNLALALYYDSLQINGRGLWEEARTLLDEVSQTHPDAPAVYLYLGNVLSKMKLWDEAQKSYEDALTQAVKLNDLESQAKALSELWQITGNQTNYDEAVNLFNEIGAKAEAEQLQEIANP